MGFTYRKSVRVGPFRVNVSGAGVGWSVGAGGLRTGVSARGRRYSTFTIPGTGLSYRTSGRGGGCLGVVAAGMGVGLAGVAWATWRAMQG